MNDTTGPFSARDVVDRLEAQIVDLDALTTPDERTPPAEASASDRQNVDLALPGTTEPPD